MTNPGTVEIIDTLVQKNGLTYALVNAKDVGGDGSSNTLASATFGANTIDYSIIQQASADILLGNSTASPGNLVEIPLGTGLSFVGGALTSTAVGGVSSVNTATGAVTLTVSNTGSLLEYDSVTPTQLNIPTATNSINGLLSSTDRITFNGKQNALGYTAENVANKGAANGYCPLDASTKVPVAYLPSVVMEYQGSWDPAINTPALSDSTGTNGYTYYVNTAYAPTISGLTDPSMQNFQIGELVIYSASVGKWQLVTPAAGVSFVNGAQGAVTVNAINRLTGDVTTSTASQSQSLAATVVAINGASLAGLATGILKNTTATGVPSIAIASDFPTLNQNTTGNAATATTATNMAGGVLGSVGYQSAANTTLLLAGNTTATKNFLVQTGTGSVSAAPAWATIATADLPAGVVLSSAGVLTSPLVEQVDVLTYASTILVNAALGNIFTVTLTGTTAILGNPAGALNGQKLLFRIRQDATGSRLLTFAANYRFGTYLPSTAIVLSTAPNAVDYLGVIYNGTDSVFDVLSFNGGF